MSDVADVINAGAALTWVGRLGFSYEFAHHSDHIQINYSGKVQEFNEVDAALTAFDVCNERLMPA